MTVDLEGKHAPTGIPRGARREKEPAKRFVQCVLSS
jgi:hypothetical protein